MQTSSASNYEFKVNNKNSRTKSEICSKLTIKTPKRRHWRRSGVFIVNSEHISHFVLVFLSLTLTKLMSTGINEVRKQTQSEPNKASKMERFCENSIQL